MYLCFMTSFARPVLRFSHFRELLVLADASFFFGATERHQLDLLPVKLDLELFAGLEIMMAVYAFPASSSR